MSPATPNERPRRGSRVQPPERLGQLGGHAADRVTTHPLTQMGDPSDAGPGAGRRLRLLSAVAGLCAIVGAAAVTWTSVGRPAPDGAAPQSVTADRDHDRVLEVRPGDSVYAEVKVTAIDHARRRVTLETHCAVGDTVVLKGEALVLAPSRKFD